MATLVDNRNSLLGGKKKFVFNKMPHFPRVPNEERQIRVGHYGDSSLIDHFGNALKSPKLNHMPAVT